MKLIADQGSYAKRVCPNDCGRGGDPFLSLAKLEFAGMKYCPDCGGEIKEETVYFNAFKCSNCGRRVNEHWNYCPWCGEEKEDK